MNSAVFDRADSVLVIGAHSDDIEIGCGGSILKLCETRPDIQVHWIVLSAKGVRADEAKNSAQQFLAQASESAVRTYEFTDGFFPNEWSDIKQTFEAVKKDIDPDLIFTHQRDDAHQDHRVVAELTWNTFRNHLILEYEIPKYDGDLGRPNAFISFDETIANRKCEILLSCFESQASKPWFDKEVFSGLMRLRGMECAAPGRFAEAFYARKVALS